MTIKNRLLLIFTVLSLLSFPSCTKDDNGSVDNAFELNDTWWMAKGWGGNTNYFFHFTSETEFDFYDYGVNRRRQSSALYQTTGKMVSNADQSVTFSFRAASIDLDGYWKDKDISGSGWFDDLVFTSGKWNPSKPTTQIEASSAKIDVSCHSDDIIWGKVSGDGRDFDTSFKMIDKTTFKRYRDKAFE